MKITSKFLHTVSFTKNRKRWIAVGIVVTLLLTLLMVFLLRLMNKAFFARDFYGTLIVVGIVTMMLFQVFENVGMAMGIMPVTGLPLPFFSYGGTSMLINMAAVGLVFSVALRGRKA